MRIDLYVIEGHAKTDAAVNSADMMHRANAIPGEKTIYHWTRETPEDATYVGWAGIVNWTLVRSWKMMGRHG